MTSLELTRGICPLTAVMRDFPLNNSREFDWINKGNGAVGED